MIATSTRTGKVDRLLALCVASVAILAGLLLRYLARDHLTYDIITYLLPWYDVVRANGLQSLGQHFTNYTPFYSYLLLIAVQFDGWTNPLYLIKAIPFFFEFASAIVAARLVWHASANHVNSAVAFAAMWLAPTVLYNGAMWGQADSIWTFFCLLSVDQLTRGRPRAGLFAFAIAFSVKAQAIFLAPLIFAFVLKRSLHWAWLAAIPAVYGLLAVPALLMGLPIGEVLTVYLEQAGTFNRLSMNAANLWLFVDNSHYQSGVVIGLLAAAAGGLALPVVIARSKAVLDVNHIVLAAALVLLLMPFLLPKMHDRYFYAFEMTIIILACLQPRFAPIAIAAQVNGVLAYFAFDGITAWGLPLAALGNTLIVLTLGRYGFVVFSRPHVDAEKAYSVRLFVAAYGYMCLCYLGVVALLQMY